MRAELFDQRKQLSSEEVANISRRIVAKCVELIPWNKTRYLHTYVPIAKHREADTWLLLEYVWSDYPEIATVVPVMSDGHMRASVINDHTRWERDKLGIPKPLHPNYLDSTQKFDTIIVPILGFDRSGHRIGYGKGQYDRFLEQQPDALKIGLAYSDSEIESGIPSEPHDVVLDAIVTETEIILLSVSKFQT